MTQINIGLFTLSVRYLHKPKGRHTWHYRRPVPVDLRHHYPTPLLIKSLKTRDKTQATHLCLQVNDRFEREFDRLRRGLPKQRSKPVHEEALRLLYQFDIAPDIEMSEQARTALEGEFLNYLENKLASKLSKEDFEKAWYVEGKIPSGCLDVVEEVALDILRGRYRPNASAYPEHYVSFKHREDDKKFRDEANRAIDYLLEFLPDKPPGEYTRAEVRLLISSHLEKEDVKTATLDRQLRVLRAMFNKVSLELELQEDKAHPFYKFDIPGKGEDVQERKDFSGDELSKLRAPITARNSEISQLIHLMLETGLRINECCGLKVEDVVLTKGTPYLNIHRNTFRRLKTKNSKRIIPLVGVALEAMRSAVEGKKESEWVFPGYIDEKGMKTKNGSASAAINKRIKATLGEGAPTCHSFRHTFNTRLRNVGCPKDIRDELGGWAKTISDKYGTPTDLKIKARYISKSFKK